MGYFDFLVREELKKKPEKSFQEIGLSIYFYEYVITYQKIKYSEKTFSSCACILQAMESKLIYIFSFCSHLFSVWTSVSLKQIVSRLLILNILLSIYHRFTPLSLALSPHTSSSAHFPIRSDPNLCQTKDKGNSAHFVGLPTSPAILSRAVRTVPGVYASTSITSRPLSTASGRETLHYFTYFLVQLFIIAPGFRH